MGKEMRIDINHSGIVNPKDLARMAEQEAERHNNNIRDEVEDLLEVSIRTKTLIGLVYEQYRGAGKSTLLLEKAKELGAVLIVPYDNFRYHSYASDVKWYGESAMSFSNLESAREIKIHSNGFLVDEGVPPEIIKELSIKNEFLGGFGRL